MQQPNIIALPTSQMQAYCDVLKLDSSVQESMASMVVALEAADFGPLKVGVTHNFKPGNMGVAIVRLRKATLGRV